MGRWLVWSGVITGAIKKLLQGGEEGSWKVIWSLDHGHACFSLSSTALSPLGLWSSQQMLQKVLSKKNRLVLGNYGTLKEYCLKDALIT